MKPTPKKIAALISLLGMGLTWTGIVRGEDDQSPSPEPSTALGNISKEMAIRGALGLSDEPKTRAVIIGSAPEKNVPKETKQPIAIAKEPPPSVAEWTKAILGLEKVEVRSAPVAQTAAPKTQAEASKPQRQELLTAIKLALSLDSAPETEATGQTADTNQPPPMPATPQIIVLKLRNDKTEISANSAPAPEKIPERTSQTVTQAALPPRQLENPEPAPQHVALTLNPTPELNSPDPNSKSIETTPENHAGAASKEEKALAANQSATSTPDEVSPLVPASTVAVTRPPVETNTEQIDSNAPSSVTVRPLAPAGGPIIVLIKLPDAPSSPPPQHSESVTLSATNPSKDVPGEIALDSVTKKVDVSPEDYMDNLQHKPSAAPIDPESTQIAERTQSERMPTAGAPKPATASPQTEQVELTGHYEIRSTGEDEFYAVDTIRVHDETGKNPLRGDWLVLSDARLDDMRGGFETDTGLKISFGIERAVYINGNLVTTTSLNVSDLSKLSGGQVQAQGLNGGSLARIQSGPGNTFQPGPISSSAVGTIVQNTLNDQKIQNVTTINATVNSMQILKALNLQSTIRDALTNSVRR